MPAQSRTWCFTINNYTQADQERLLMLVPDKATYLIYGRELGESGTRHLQGYVVFPAKKRMLGVKQLIGNRSHLEAAKGSHEDNYQYCSKDGDYEEWGEKPINKQGSRSDLEAIRLKILRGDSILSIANDHFSDFVRYGRGIERYAYLNMPHRSWLTRVYVFVGDTRTGKTRLAYLKGGSHPDKVWMSDPDNLKWFDGYTGQDYAIFDELTGGACKITTMLRLLDRYPMRVPVKGGYTQWAPKVIFICTNIQPEAWYPNAVPKHMEALQERLFQVIQFSAGTFASLKTMPF